MARFSASHAWYKEFDNDSDDEVENEEEMDEAARVDAGIQMSVDEVAEANAEKSQQLLKISLQTFQCSEFQCITSRSKSLRQIKQTMRKE